MLGKTLLLGTAFLMPIQALEAATCNLAYPAKGYTVTYNLAYKVESDGSVQALDLYMPDSTQFPNPAIVVDVHGGSFISGDKSQRLAYASEIAQNGFAVAELNYRLAPQYPFPAAVQDVRCAVRAVHQWAPTYGYMNSVGGMGYSAGANLVTMAAVTSGLHTAVDGVTPLDSPNCVYEDRGEQFMAVMGYYGMYDFWLRELGESYVSYLNGQAGYPHATPSVSQYIVPTTAANMLNSSPIGYALPSNYPPSRLVHGELDTVTVPENQGIEWQQYLTGYGKIVTRDEEPELGHGFNPFNVTDSTYWNDPTYQQSACATMTFLHQYLDNPAATRALIGP